MLRWLVPSLSLVAGWAVAQSAGTRPPPAVPCGERPTQGCRDVVEQMDRPLQGCVLRVATVAVGVHDDSAGATERQRQLEVSLLHRDGGVPHAEVLAREAQVEGSSSSFESWEAPGGLLLRTTRSVLPPGADYELGPMDTAQALVWVTVEPSCRLARTPVDGRYVDASTGESLSLTTPTLPHGGPRDEPLRVEYASTKRPKPVRLAVTAFDPGHRTATVAFKDQTSYRLELERGALTVTPAAGGKSQRFLKAPAH